MSSSHHTRSTSTRRTRRVQIVAPLHSSRSSSAPQRQFIIILTNDPELLQPTGPFQPHIQQNMQTTTRSAQTSATNNGGAVNNNNNQNNNREQILNNLLRVELREAASHYLTRTRRSYPIHYIFDMSDIDTEQL
ncbi:unnamed protein product [Rotaria sordida]|uniref:Uncharacterized protein n=1 Tax=Rotaria sordida TaxID=392033 RepID=A0A819E8B4_9BILA|nr:unnamed protein product [Rotaria sordida]CAF3846193.1 unnamed protein product [Rotaria sordida]